MNKLFRFVGVASFILILWSCNGQSGLNPASSPDVARQQQSDARFGASLSGLASQGYTYEVTIENLTPATAPGASQPFSPPVLATHARIVHIFKTGQYASGELAQLAEDAVSAPLVKSLNNTVGVNAVAQGNGVIFPGSSSRITINAIPGFLRLSLVSMMVNTNDAFVGLDDVHLPIRGSKTVYLHAYDAGSEKNTELAANIPGPCCGSPLIRVPTHEKISRHAGILGVGDLDPAVFGWNDPVAKVTITRVQ